MRRNFKQEILAEIAEVRKSLDSIERMLRDLDDGEETADFSNFQRHAAAQISSRGRKISQTAAPAANVPARNFTGEYNALADKSGVELRNARADFFQRYQVKTFSCVNAEARVKSPAPPPEFRDRDGGDFWAIPSALVSGSANENTYVVYPNIAIRYTANHHFERALGEVFESNFVSGGTYSKIRVEQFAVFTCSGEGWTLFRKGRLKLE